jgi:hypothetical protein
MKIRGKLHIEILDVQMYEGIADLAEKKKKRIEEELIPTFIIEEALNYYSDLEKYEICQKIKIFFSELNLQPFQRGFTPIFLILRLPLFSLHFK